MLALPEDQVPAKTCVVHRVNQIRADVLQLVEFGLAVLPTAPVKGTDVPLVVGISELIQNHNHNLRQPFTFEQMFFQMRVASPASLFFSAFCKHPMAIPN